MTSLWFAIPAGLLVGGVLVAILYAHLKGLNNA